MKIYLVLDNNFAEIAVWSKESKAFSNPNAATKYLNHLLTLKHVRGRTPLGMYSDKDPPYILKEVNLHTQWPDFFT